MSKGSKRRPTQVPEDRFESNWTRTFGGDAGATDRVTPTECADCGGLGALHGCRTCNPLPREYE